MSEFLIQDKHAEPINIKAIYEGDVKLVKIAGTDQYKFIGSGRVLWDISQQRDVPYIPVAYEHWYGASTPNE